MGVALGIISLGLIASAPIQGALLGNNQADYVWIKPIAFAGVSLFFFGIIVDNNNNFIYFPSFFLNL